MYSLIVLRYNNYKLDSYQLLNFANTDPDIQANANPAGYAAAHALRHFRTGGL
jgi:hypothetical protein